MPLYSFQCDNCGNVFDIRASIKEHEAGLAPTCPTCDSSEVRQLIVAVMMIYSTKNTPSGSCCGSNAKSGCCG